MPSRQRIPVSAPREQDKALSDFAESIQRNLSDLYFTSHTHDALIRAPLSSEGSVGDIKLATINSLFYLYAKFSSGWKRVQVL